MLKRFAQLAGLTLLLGVMFVPPAHARTQFSVQIGPSFPISPVVVAPVPPPGYVWQSGYYVWSGFGYRWVPGTWVPAPYLRGRWAGDRWERERRDLDRDRNWDRDRNRRDRDRDERGNWRR